MKGDKITIREQENGDICLIQHDDYIHCTDQDLEDLIERLDQIQMKRRYKKTGFAISALNMSTKIPTTP